MGWANNKMKSNQAAGKLMVAWICSLYAVGTGEATVPHTTCYCAIMRHSDPEPALLYGFLYLQELRIILHMLHRDP